MQVHQIVAATLLMNIIIGQVTSDRTTVVQTSSGPERGRISKTIRRSVEYASFLGIPYAKAPEGELRFRPPVEIENWSEVFEANREGNACIQFYLKNSSIIGSENCLFLNVFTPHTRFDEINENKLKPVMVWIYGGGFSIGTATYNAGPDFILEEDVIMVSMNYRLGPFGFLNLNHKNASGNMALKDQNLALKWAKKNIVKFGGDPNKITIFGQSAGAVSVDYHVLSGMSAGLFNRSISMSGSPVAFLWGVQSASEAQSQAKTLASKLGSKAKTNQEILKALKAASAKDIVMKALENPVFPPPFRPTVERVFDVNNEKFVSRCAVDKYRSGDFNKGPHMLGFTSREVMASTLISDLLKLISRNKDVLKNASITLNPPLERFSNSANVLEKLQRAVTEELSKSLTDLFFVTGIDAKQKMMLKHNKYPTYYYRFSYESDLPAKIENRRDTLNISGVRHADDLMYLFYISPLQIENKNPGIELTINRFVRLLTNFAKFGNPTPDGQKDELLNVKWPNSGLLGLHLEINKELSVGPRPASFGVLLNQAIGIGTSRLLNSCL